MQKDFYKKQKDELCNYSINKWITENCSWITEDVKGKTHSEVRTLLYLYYAFENYNFQRNHPYCSDSNELDNEFGSILDKHSQYHKYGLVPIDVVRELIPIDPPRIYDKSINKTFFTKNIPLILMDKIAEMISNGFVKECKKIFMKWMERSDANGNTTELSNLGVVKLPEQIDNLDDRLEFAISLEQETSYYFSCVTMGDTLTLIATFKDVGYYVIKTIIE